MEDKLPVWLPPPRSRGSDTLLLWTVLSVDDSSSGDLNINNHFIQYYISCNAAKAEVVPRIKEKRALDYPETPLLFVDSIFLSGWTSVNH